MVTTRIYSSWAARGLAAVGALALLLVLPAQGSVTNLVFQFDTTFSADSVAPDGSGPWVTTTFAPTNGGVLMTVSNANLVGSEKTDETYFNINPKLDVTKLTFSLQNQVGGFSAPTIATGEDGFKADGDGYYDIQLQFSTSGPASFMGGDSVTYLVAGITNLAVTDFDYLSSPGGGAGPFYAAAHVQGTGGGGKSAWLEPSSGPTFFVVPEPAPATLLGIAAGLLCLARRWSHGRSQP